jgi:4-amino-4-deoxy-L-arabinose transferase-like glycosyltransferase
MARLSSSTEAPDVIPRRVARPILALILLTNFLFNLHHLEHPAIKGLDESFHAVVARNLLHHPFTPILIEHPYLEFAYRDWQANHIWLHKPILPLWQIALSLALFGVSMLALRLPSAILATASGYLTYAIGQRLLGRLPALIAASLQAFTPALMTLVQGYVFSDHIDVALLFWTELAILLLMRAIFGPSRRVTLYVILAGVAQACAFLSKTYPAFVVTLIAAAACFLRLLKPRHLGLFFAVTVLTIAPWTIACAIRFPEEFTWEHTQIFRHLGADVEGFSAPWDRLLFEYSLNIYHLFYAPVLVAAILLLPRAIKERNARLGLLYTWALGVLVPHLLATSKTPTATLIGWPPFLLLFAELIHRAVRGDALALVAWITSTLLALIFPGAIPPAGFGYPTPPHFGVIFRQNIWVFYHVLIALAAALTFQKGVKSLSRARLGLTVIASISTLVLFARIARVTWKVTEQNESRPNFSTLGAFGDQRLGPNAVFLVDQRQKLEYMMAMFWTTRTAYPLGRSNWQALAERVRAHNGEPYIVSHRRLPLPLVFTDSAENLFIYSTKEADLRAFSAEFPTELNIRPRS